MQKNCKNCELQSRFVEGGSQRAAVLLNVVLNAWSLNASREADPL